MHRLRTQRILFGFPCNAEYAQKNHYPILQNLNVHTYKKSPTCFKNSKQSPNLAALVQQEEFLKNMKDNNVEGVGEGSLINVGSLLFQRSLSLHSFFFNSRGPVTINFQRHLSSLENRELISITVAVHINFYLRPPHFFDQNGVIIRNIPKSF